jgi:hypothetical protein
MEKLQLLSVHKAAAVSGITYRQMRHAIETGRVKTITLGKRPYIPAGHLRGFIQDANKFKGGKEPSAA